MRDEKRMPNRQEHQFMTDTMILRNTLVKNGPAVRERLAATGYRYGWRDVRLALALVTKLQRLLLATMPDKRQKYYERLASQAVYKVDIPGPTDRDHGYVFADMRDLAVVTEAAMTNYCTMCVLDGKELKKCALRTALQALAPLEQADTDNPFAVCEFRDVASGLARGEDTLI